MRSKGRAAAAAAMSEINITPMIDVLLVLLIIFMVVTPVAQRAIDASLPEQSRGPRDAGPDFLVLEIEPEVMRLNQQPVASFADLDSRLRSALETRGDKTLFVKASGALVYGTVIEVLDVARGAGVERFGIMGRDADASDDPA